MLWLDLSSELLSEHHKQQRYEEIAESLRLLYVALTRAKSRCYVAWGNIRSADRSALAYLLHPNRSESEKMLEAGVVSRLKVLSDELIIKDLKALEKKSENAIHVSMLDEIQLSKDGREGAPSPGADRQAAWELRRFAGHIPKELRITSYSALLRRRQGVGSHAALGGAAFRGAAIRLTDIDLADHDTVLLRRTESEQPDSDSKGTGRGNEAAGHGDDIFAFPKGARAGNFFHSVFERIDFAQAGDGNRDAIIEQCLAAFGFDNTWAPVVEDTVRRTVSLPLTSEGLQLSRIERDARISELEFLFSLETIDPAGLGRIFHENGEPGVGDQLQELSFSSVHGYLKGFIDLVFRYEDRYYLVDWKSNHLGSQSSSYHRDILADVMVEEYYVLQYHLYSVALHRYLEQHVPQYSYRRHFGGIFYLFIRGIDARQGPEYGLFQDLPQESLIMSLDAYIKGGVT